MDEYIKRESAMDIVRRQKMLRGLRRQDVRR